MLPKLKIRNQTLNFQTPATVFLLFIFGALITSSMPAAIKPNYLEKPHKTKNENSNWFNPCNYDNRRKRHSKKSLQALYSQINITINDYKKNVNGKFTNFTFQCKNDFNDVPNLKEFYKEFTAMGKTLTKIISMKINYSDNSFDYKGRIKILKSIRNKTKSVMCEIHDILKPKIKDWRTWRKEILKKIADKKVRQMNIFPLTTQDTSEIVMKDPCLYDIYIKLLYALKRRVEFNLEQRRKNHSKQSEKVPSGKSKKYNKVKRL